MSRTNRPGFIAVAVLLAAVLTIEACGGTGTTSRPSSTAAASSIPSVGAAETASPESHVAWTYATSGSIYGGSTVSAGAVYFGSDDGYLYSVDIASHQLRWRFKTSGLIRSTPAIDGVMAYVASDDGNAYAINVSDGSPAWKVNIGNDAVARVLPAADNSVWDYRQSSPVVSGGVVYVGSADGHMYALDAKTGVKKWTFDTPGMVRSTALVAGDVVYFGSWEGISWHGRLFALDARSGAQKWSFEGAGDHPTPMLANGLLYVGGRDAMFYALDSATGSTVWTQSFGGSWVESSAVYFNGIVIVGSSDGFEVQGFDAGKGDLRWAFSTGGYTWSSPVVAAGVVYVGTAGPDGSATAGLWAVDATSGDQLWWSGGGPSIDTSPKKLGGVVAGPVVADSVIYVGALDGRLYALRAN